METISLLVVDDEPGIRSGIQRILSRHIVSFPFMDEDYSFEVSEASTGEEALAILEKEAPDILLLDNKLPGMDGMEVLEIIRSRNMDIMVAMITSYASLEIAARATDDGARDFIPKPFAPEHLRIATIANIDTALDAVGTDTQREDHKQYTKRRRVEWRDRNEGNAG